MMPEEPSTVTALALADELGRRLKEDMNSQVGTLLGEFLEEMKRVPESVLQDISVNRERILSALDDQLAEEPGGESRIEGELERLRKEAEEAQQAHADAEQALSELHTRFTQETDTLKEQAAAEAARISKAKTDAETHAQASRLSSEALESRLRSARKVTWVLGGALLILILIAVGYIGTDRPEMPGASDGRDGAAEGVAVTVEPKTDAEGTPSMDRETLVPASEDPARKAVDAPTVVADPVPAPPEPVLPVFVGEVYYPSGSVAVPDEMMANIRSAADTYRDEPGTLILIEGYADDRRLRETILGRYIDNLGLSQARAGNLARLLINNGIAPERISIIGHGSDRPFVPNDTPENRALNRRAVIKTIDNLELN